MLGSYCYSMNFACPSLFLLVFPLGKGHSFLPFFATATTTLVQDPCGWRPCSFPLTFFGCTLQSSRPKIGMTSKNHRHPNGCTPVYPEQSHGNPSPAYDIAHEALLLGRCTADLRRPCPRLSGILLYCFPFARRAVTH